VWMLGGSEADTSGYKDDYVVYSPTEVPVLLQLAQQLGAP